MSPRIRSGGGDLVHAPGLAAEHRPWCCRPLQLSCSTPEEIDHYWEKPSEGGDPRAQQCGWLTDKYGLSWQVIPDSLDEPFGGQETAGSARAMEPMLRMRKIDLAEMRRAYEEGVRSAAQPPGVTAMEQAGPANVYDDLTRAEAYASLDFPGTYYLAFRDLPAIILAHVSRGAALDFGCGTGRSTRFLKALGFEAVGIDISPNMIAQAVGRDPGGHYRLVEDGDFSAFADESFDLVLSAFAFDNIPGEARRAGLLRGLTRVLRRDGRIVLLGSRPEIYTHEWASFTTWEFPQNRDAGSGEAVQIVMKDVTDARPVVDFLFCHEDYLDLFSAAALELIEAHTPLGRPDEPFEWLSETLVAPWVIYVLGRC